MIRQITIEPVLNGFVLQVGCQKVVLADTKQLANEIRKYYDDPEETEKSYIKNAVNKMPDVNPICSTTIFSPTNTLGIGGMTTQSEYPRTATECGLR